MTVLEAFTYAARDTVDGLLAEHDHVLPFAAESQVDRALAMPTEFGTTNLLGNEVPLDAPARAKGRAGEVCNTGGGTELTDTGLTALLLRARSALAVSARRTGTTGAVAC